jgi:hypothetical protein
MSRADTKNCLFSAHRLGECVLTWVAEVAKSLLHARHKAEAALASAAFRYIRLTRVAYGGNLRQSGLARFGKFSEVFFDAGAEATLAALNSGTLRLNISCTLPTLLRHRDGCGKQHRSADYYEALHHSSSPRQTLWCSPETRRIQAHIHHLNARLRQALHFGQSQI